MPKGFKDAAAQSKPVYGTLIGSAQTAEPMPVAQEVHSTTQSGRAAKQQRINMAFTPENLDYMRTIAGLKGISITRFVNDLIAKDREKNSTAYSAARNLSEQL